MNYKMLINKNISFKINLILKEILVIYKKSSNLHKYFLFYLCNFNNLKICKKFNRIYILIYFICQEPDLNW